MIKELVRHRVKTVDDVQRQLDVICDKIDELVRASRAPVVVGMTTGQRDAITYPEEGMVIYNTTTPALERFSNGAWVVL